MSESLFQIQHMVSALAERLCQIQGMVSAVDERLIGLKTISVPAYWHLRMLKECEQVNDSLQVHK